MVNFDYQTPTRLIFGKGVVSEKLAGVMSKFGKNVLINPKHLRNPVFYSMPPNKNR